VHREGHARGVRVHPQVTCRPLSLQMSLVNPTPFVGAPAFKELIARPPDERAGLYRDAAWRARARDELVSGRWHHVRWHAMTIAETGDASVAGRTVAALAEASGRDPFDVLVDIALADDLATRITMTVGNDDPDAVAELLVEDGCLLGISDAGAHVGMLCDAGMPVELLASWVRDRKVLSLEQGVHRLTGEPAAVFGLARRGSLVEGHAADLLVVDLERLAPSPLRRVHDLPAGGDRLVADQVRGIEHIVVNGRRRAGEDSFAGRVLRRAGLADESAG
jgi:N-acyl-D-aspartate/D-glutamate deacylase